MENKDIFEKLKNFFDGKSVLILGYGREGESTLELLKSLGISNYAVADKRQLDPDEIGCKVYCGDDYLSHLADYDVIMKAPGIGLKNDVPDSIKQKITCQADLFLRYCPVPVIGVTGTKGKSTVSSLIYHFLCACGKKTMLIGNIGVPPLQREAEFSSCDAIVCELSCHQLEYVKASPAVSVLLNVYPEHLDHYAGFEEYRAAKTNIYRYQKDGDTLIINGELDSEIHADTKAGKILAGYGGDIGVRDNGIFVFDKFYPAEKINTRLRGEHNLYNIAVALCAAKIAGCDIDKCIASLPDFSPLEHRLEYVCTIDGVEYINDSISTAPQTAIAALKAYPDTDTLIIGGMDRGISYQPLAEYLNMGTELKNLIVLPDSGIRAAKDITADGITKYYAKDMEEAVLIAKAHTKVRCILSPAAASYGFYKNFEERGKHYKSLLGYGGR